MATFPQNVIVRIDPTGWSSQFHPKGNSTKHLGNHFSMLLSSNSISDLRRTGHSTKWPVLL